MLELRSSRAPSLLGWPIAAAAGWPSCRVAVVGVQVGVCLLFRFLPLWSPSQSRLASHHGLAPSLSSSCSGSIFSALVEVKPCANLLGNKLLERKFEI